MPQGPAHPCLFHSSLWEVLTSEQGWKPPQLCTGLGAWSLPTLISLAYGLAQACWCFGPLGLTSHFPLTPVCGLFVDLSSFCRSMTRGEPTTTTSSSVPSSPCWLRKVSCAAWPRAWCWGAGSAGGAALSVAGRPQPCSLLLPDPGHGVALSLESCTSPL